MIIREAESEDIPGIRRVRNAVRENRFSDPGPVTDAACHNYLFNREKGRVAYTGVQIAGFAIADLQDSNIGTLRESGAREVGCRVRPARYDAGLVLYAERRGMAEHGTRYLRRRLLPGCGAGMPGTEIRFEMRAGWGPAQGGRCRLRGVNE